MKKTENDFVSKRQYYRLREKFLFVRKELEEVKDQEQIIEILKNTIEKLENESKLCLNQEQAAKAIGVSLETFRKWRRQGIIKSHQIEGRLFFIPSELMDAIKNN